MRVLGSGSPSRVVVAAMVTAAAGVAHHVVGKATRDTLFLSSYAVGSLPVIMVAGAVASLAMMLLLGRVLIVAGPRRVVPALFGMSSVIALAEWLLVASSPRLAAVLVYFHVTVFGTTTISAFWSLINERFDARMAKRRIARIATGGTLGGVVGGFVAFVQAATLGPRGLLLILATLHASAAVSSLVVGARADAAVESRPAASSPLAVLRTAPYLRHLGILVALAAAMDALFDFMLGAQASATFGTGARLLSFFALYHMTVGVLTFVVQLALAERLVKKIGATGVATLLPTFLIVVTTLAMQLPRMATIALLRGMTSVVGNSVWRSGYELLFTPLTPSRKRSTKVIIDVGFDRVGTAIGGLLAFVCVAIVPHLAVSVLLRVTILLAVVALLFAARLRHGYVEALEGGLRANALRLADRRLATLDRERLLHEVEMLRNERLLTLPDDVPDVSARPIALDADDEDATRRMLETETVHRWLIPRVIDLVGHPLLHGAAISALRRVADEHAGVIVDALLGVRTPFDVRRRLPRVLARCSVQRALDGLVDALGDSRFDVRREAGLALLHLAAAHPALVVPRERILDAAEREVAADRAVWDVEPPLEAEELEVSAPFLDRIVRDRTARSLEHVFALLSLVYGRDPMQLALRALYSDSPALRGTALEYLDNVLPTSLRDALWPYVGDRARAARPATSRTRKALLDALLRSGPLTVPRPLDE
jgi:hypothetical protein